MLRLSASNTIFKTMKDVLVCRQQAGDPKSRDPLKSVLKLPCLMLVLQKWMTYIVLLILSCSSNEEQVGRTSKYL